MNDRPCLLITMGDVAGIGPEIIARAWPELDALCRPVVVGDPGRIRWALAVCGLRAEVRAVQHPSEVEPERSRIPCLPGSKEEVSQVVPGQVSAAAGKA